MKVMQLDKILDVIVSKEVYKEVKVECKLPYHPFELVRNTVEKIKTQRHRDTEEGRRTKQIRDTD